MRSDAPEHVDDVLVVSHRFHLNLLFFKSIFIDDLIVKNDRLGHGAHGQVFRGINNKEILLQLTFPNNDAILSLKLSNNLFFSNDNDVKILIFPVYRKIAWFIAWSGALLQA